MSRNLLHVPLIMRTMNCINHCLLITTALSCEQPTPFPISPLHVALELLVQLPEILPGVVLHTLLTTDHASVLTFPATKVASTSQVSCRSYAYRVNRKPVISEPTRPSHRKPWSDPGRHPTPHSFSTLSTRLRSCKPHSSDVVPYHTRSPPLQQVPPLH